MSSFSFRSFLVALTMSMFVMACDGTESLSDITINVTIEGTGTGSVEAQTVGIDIACKVTDGAVSGSCSDAFQDRDGGLIRLEAKPDAVTNFSWGGYCRQSVARLCELSFRSGEDAVFDVIGRFEAKTTQVIITPKPITMTVAGANGAIVATAQALDENGAEVFGVSYAWATSDAAVATVTPEQNNRQATIVALSNGAAIITATTQGITGQAQVDVSIAN